MPHPEKQRLSRRQWLARVAGGAATLAGSAAVYAWRIEPHWVEVTHQTMPYSGLPPALVGKRLVQISDLHVGDVVDNHYLRRVLRRVAELEPDYLAITGDFMTCNRAEQIDLTIDTLREAPIADVPTVAALGNHDYSHNFRNAHVADQITDRLRGVGVRLLRNESTELDGLQVVGCDDLWARRTDLYEALSDVDLTRPALCLAHNPDIADLNEWSTFNGWVLSGHTHGGQCRFPLVGAPVLPIKNHRYARGHIALSGSRNLYVNRGLGYSARVRFGARPEVTVFTLTSV